MDEKTILIVGAVLAGAWYFMRKPAAATAGGAAAPAAGIGGGATTPAPAAREPYSWELGSSQTTPREATWPYSNADWPKPYTGPRPLLGDQANPLADPLASQAVPMPKIPITWTP